MTSSSQKRSVGRHPGADPDTPGVAVPEPRPATLTVPEVAGGYPGQRLGYLRVSLDRQDEAPQRLAAERAGVAHTFVDHGVTSTTPVLERAGWLDLLAYARPGDTVCVWRLDRVSRAGIRSTLEVAEDLRSRGLGLVSLTEGIALDATPVSEVLLAVLAWAAQQEHRAISERTRLALAQRRAAGVRLGRPPVDSDKVAAARDLVGAGHSVSRAAAALGLGRSTLYRELQEAAR